MSTDDDANSGREQKDAQMRANGGDGKRDGRAEVRVTDEKHSVDQQLKSQVLNIRQTAFDDERELYTGRARNPEYPNYGHAAANQDWALSIRQYLRSIKCLWSDESDVRGVKKFWQEKRLGNAVLVPPDKNGHSFSMVAQADEYSEAQLRRAIGLPRGVELPETYRRSFVGLGDVLNNHAIEHTWVIQVDDTPPYETVTVRDAKPIPKHVLENAFEAADVFLQQAGLGFETSMPDYTAEGDPGL